MQYRRNEAVGRPLDAIVNSSRMIASGVFDRRPKLQVLIAKTGGGLPSIIGGLEFTRNLNYDGIKNPPVGRSYVNKRSPFDYFKPNILVDTMGFNAMPNVLLSFRKTCCANLVLSIELPRPPCANVS